jgi:nucleotide-binding universal stress UspA family protein
MALETVLVAVGAGDSDRIDELTKTVVDMAEPAGSTVVLAHVFTEDEYDDTRAKLDIDPNAEVTAANVAERYSTARAMRDRFDSLGVEYEVTGSVGSYGEEIVSLAEDAEADLVVVGGRKRSPTGKAVFGSTAQEVMLNAPCPVTFVRSD